MAQLTDPIVEKAEAAAHAIMEKNFTPRGLCASADGYPQVWARDTMITMLGAAIDASAPVLDCLKTSLDTLGDFQDQFGQIPYLVHCESGKSEWGSSDGNVWWVIGAIIYANKTHDKDWIKTQTPRIIKALDWCESMDIHKDGLMVSSEMIDWADLLPNHGHVLFPNVLYFCALQETSQLLQETAPEAAERFQKRSETVLDAIRDLFWVKEIGTFEEQNHFHVRTMMSAHLRSKPYFLPWVDQCNWGEHFDTPANLLAILTGVADQAQTDLILNFIDGAGINRPYPVRVLYPPIQPGESEWREYLKLFNLNLPNQYHNGGIWPWVGGLYVAALVKASRQSKAEEELVRLAQALQLGVEEWEFNEWLHGENGRPMGCKYQAWSAGVFLYALHAVRTGCQEALIVK